MFKLFHLIYLKCFYVSSKHSEGMQPTTQHQIPFINFQNNTCTKKSRKGTVLYAEFFVQVGPEYHNSAHILPNFLR